MQVKNKKFRRWVIAVGLMAAVGVLALVVNHFNHPAHEQVAAETPRAAGQTAQSSQESSDARSVTITVLPITVRPVQRAVGAVGTFFGYDEVTVMAEVPGRVAKIHRDVGDIVRPGELLLEIDPTDYQLAVEETRRALELEATRIGLPIPSEEDFQPDKILAILRSNRFDVNTIPMVLQAKEREENARSRLERAKLLRERNSIAQEDLDQRSTDYQVALTNRVQAMLDAQSVLAGIKHRLVLLRITEQKLKYTRVVVPTPTQREGMPKDVKYAIAERKATEGDMVKDAGGASTAAFELVMDGVLNLKATVPERYVGQVQKGQKAEIHVEAYPEKAFVGTVIRVNPMVDRTSRTFLVEVYVDNSGRQLKAGGFAKVDILTHVDPQAWTVPTESIVSYAGSTKIYVVRDGKAHAVAIARGLEGRGWVEILRTASPDLRREDKVITSGQEKLAEGVAVLVRGGGK